VEVAAAVSLLATGALLLLAFLGPKFPTNALFIKNDSCIN
jgi:hypothetical protein